MSASYIIACMLNQPSDLTIKYGQRSWYCHRDIVHAGCPALKRKAMEWPAGTISLDDDDRADVELVGMMVEIIYTQHSNYFEGPITFRNFVRKLDIVIFLQHYGIDPPIDSSGRDLINFLKSFDPNKRADESRIVSSEGKESWDDTMAYMVRVVLKVRSLDVYNFEEWETATTNMMVYFSDYWHLLEDHHLLYEDSDLMDDLLEARAEQGTR